MNEWIRIDDRLPEYGIMVLVINDLCPEHCFVAEHGGDYIFFTNEDESSVFPTHWMELPKPPDYIPDEDEDG